MHAIGFKSTSFADDVHGMRKTFREFSSTFPEEHHELCFV